MNDQDSIIIEGLKSGSRERLIQEKNIYQQYSYFIDEGCRKKNLNEDDSFSAYSDAVLSAIHNIVSGKFDGRSSIKTYLFQIFSNKCVDYHRRNSTNKEQVHNKTIIPELITQLSDGARNAVEKIINGQKQLVVKQQLESIGDKCKKVLLMFEDGFSDKEIAAEMGYNNSAVVKTTRLRCLEKLRENMQNMLQKI